MVSCTWVKMVIVGRGSGAVRPQQSSPTSDPAGPEGSPGLGRAIQCLLLPAKHKSEKALFSQINGTRAPMPLCQWKNNLPHKTVSCGFPVPSELNPHPCWDQVPHFPTMTFVSLTCLQQESSSRFSKSSPPLKSLSSQ